MVLDEIHSPTYQNCSATSVPFKELKQNDCSFSVGDYEFDILKTYKIDQNGNLKSYSKYVSEGPMTYSTTNLDTDSLFKKHEDLEYFSVQISKDRTAIIDLNDTLEIEQIFKPEKLILIKNKIVKGQRLLYAY